MVRELVRDKKLRARVLERADEFLLNNRSGEEVWFRELVLCLLTSNSSFISSYKALVELYSYDITTLSKDKISSILKNSGYRFYNLKAIYIKRAIDTYYGKLKSIVKPIADIDQISAREFLVSNVKGLGYKESSHFLRNVGYFDLAIVDRHILKFVNNYLYVNIKKVDSKRRYLLVEGLLKALASSLNMQVGLLDLFIFFKQTQTLVK
ncbi:N-glycosylase/DNA lyase [Stygiolobus caldivivus]|uniref:8-oxoguanine DNA glycosylase/AP lyase n=1 Tax=Stygiolobus caldivivus TaxID=2824673 RepID=A0A8D5U8K6_9CREN|nr:N-glycosylase/DNA lyase [Stygiolobus caldivivus]BCU71217.1 DNA lyase [Stygiolobus caldivivus]